MGNSNLNLAKIAKNDEFYTQLEDIEKELSNYKNQLENKVIYCNCDNPNKSNFWKYFHLNFERLGLKKLISTYYEPIEAAYKLEYTGGNDNNTEAGVKTPLAGDGDFRSPECLAALKEADMVITNPPFSLFREFVAILTKHKKQFLILGTMNAIGYKEVFPLLKDNKVWLGCNNGSKEYRVPESYAKENPSRIYKKGTDYYSKLGNTNWYTTLDHKKRHTMIEFNLSSQYIGHEDIYPKYDNYDAINVNKVIEIPHDYTGIMGVPISFMDKYCSEQFEILGKFDKPIINGKSLFKRIAIRRIQKEE